MTAKKKKNTSSSGKRKSPHEKENPLTREITFLIIIAFGILSLLSVFHMCGVFGEVLGSFLFGLLGAMAYIFPVYLIIAAGFFIANPHQSMVRRKVIYSMGLFWSFCGIFQWVINNPAYDDTTATLWQTYTISSAEQAGGGFLGGLLSFLLARILGRAGAMVVILFLCIMFIMMLTGKLLFSSLYQLYRNHGADRDSSLEEEPAYYEEEDISPYEKKRVQGQKEAMKVFSFEKEKKKTKTDKTVDKPNKKEQDFSDIHIIGETEEDKEEQSPRFQQELDEKFGQPEKKTAKKISKKPEKNSTGETAAKEEKNEKKEMERVQSELNQAAVKEIPYTFPPLTLLSRPRAGKGGQSREDLMATAMKLKETLDSFSVKVKLGDISLGPSVTRYELIPEQGVKVSKITSLADDIKLSLAASDIRIEAPIPGKAAVGIEVPNPERMAVSLRELLESSEFTKAKSRVTFAVGKDISGKTIVTDIAKMPHLLIAGATGSGKSVLINTLIMSILYKANPNEVKLIMVDPKMVELTAYEEIPHLMIPVVKDPKKASAALGWAVAEMTNRYEKFAESGVRDIMSYNARLERVKDKQNPEFQKMPQIVIIVDEFADLMMVAPGEVEDAVCRLAQLARAAGIHLVLATQRPSVNVITGLIKANIPSRIALSVSSQVDSRTIIDSAGAEKLLGNGDMLFAPQNLPKPIRVQGAFVSDEERDSVVAFLKNSSGAPSYNEDVTKHIDTAPTPGGSSSAAGADTLQQDELFVEAGKFIIEKDKASIGLLQRMFRIGFNRAARIMDQLADAGVVGPEEGTKARQILMSMEQFENYLEENG